MSGQKSGQTCLKNKGNSAHCTVSAAVAFVEKLYPHKPAQALHHDTKISPETFRNWKDGTSAPTWRHTMALIRAYGLPFVAAVMPDNEEIVVAAMRAEIEKRRSDLDARFAELKAREARV